MCPKQALAKPCLAGALCLALAAGLRLSYPTPAGSDNRASHERQPRLAVHHSVDYGLLHFPSQVRTSPFWNGAGTRSTSNYVRNVQGLQRWGHFPLTVAFVHDYNDTRRRESAILGGFYQWVGATDGAVTFRLVADPSQAQIVVRFNPNQEISQTDTFYDPETRLLSRATVTMGLASVDGPGEEVEYDELRGLAAHEFGHALGIDGHSGYDGDLMYPSVGEENRAVTNRDLNTLRAAYVNSRNT